MWASLGLLAVAFLKCAHSTGNSVSISEQFRIFQITPQIIPVAPQNLLSDIFGEYRANLGNIIPVCATAYQPLTTWPNPNAHTLYAIIAFDPDCDQCNTSCTQMTYGIVLNIPGGNAEEADIVVPYQPPNPAPGTGFHRYICVVYKQPGSIDITDELRESFTANNLTFCIGDFVARYKLGHPYAGNFFRVQQSECEAQCENTDPQCCDCCAENCASQESTATNTRSRCRVN